MEFNECYLVASLTMQYIFSMSEIAKNIATFGATNDVN